MQPEHRPAPAFDKAREWAREQERLLTQPQRLTFDALRNRQAKEREPKQQRLDSTRAELSEREKKQKPKPELALKPPVRVFDPQTRRLARLAIANEKRLERLDTRHQTERTQTLKKFEQERARANDKSMSTSWMKAVGKAAAHEADRDQPKSLDRKHERDNSDRSR